MKELKEIAAETMRKELPETNRDLRDIAHAIAQATRVRYRVALAAVEAVFDELVTGG